MFDPVNQLPAATASTRAQGTNSPSQLSSHPTQAEFDEAASLPMILSDESVRLDTQSWDRLSALATQILEQSKLNELYLDSILSCLKAIINYLTAERLIKLAESQIVESYVEEMKSKEKLGREALTKAKGKGKETNASSTVEEKEKEDRIERRQRWRAAIDLMQPVPPSNISNLFSTIVPAAFASVLTAPAPTPKLTHLYISIQSREISTSSWKTGVESLEINFTPDQFTGTPLFKNVERLDDSDLLLVSKVGGLIHFTATGKDRIKVETALEFLVFATISLTLETGLRRDTAISRPIIEFEEEVEPEVETVETDLALAIVDSRTFTPIDHTFKAHRSRWSTSSNLWNLFAKKPPSASDLSLRRSTTTSSTATTSPKSTIRNFFGSAKDLQRTRSQRVEPSSVRSLEALAKIDRGWSLIDGLVTNPENEGSRRMGVVKEELGSTEKGTEKPKKELKNVTGLAGVIGQRMAGVLLSTSPDVAYAPPHLLVRLSEEEVLDVPVISVQTRISIYSRTGLTEMMTNNNSAEGKIKHQSMQFLVETKLGNKRCRDAKWLTYNFYDRSRDSTASTPDPSLGQFIAGLIDSANDVCEEAGCERLDGEHALLLSHAKQRVEISVGEGDGKHPTEWIILDSPPATNRTILSWMSCRVCCKHSTPLVLSLPSMVFSISKYLELLLHDTSFAVDICEHDPSDLVRCFSIGPTGKVVEFRVVPIELYELRLPTAIDPNQHSSAPPTPESIESLFTDITLFYKSLVIRLHAVEEILNADEYIAQNVNDKEDTTSEKEDTTSVVEDSENIHERGASDETIVKERSTRLALLDRMRSDFEDDEAGLLEIASNTPELHLNNGRFALLLRLRGTIARLSSWELKHLNIQSQLPPPLFTLPYYLHLYVFPVDSNVIVRRMELSSLIALTISSAAYKEQVQFSTNEFSNLASRKASPQNYGGIPSSKKRGAITRDLFLPPSPSAASSTSRSNTPPRPPLVKVGAREGRILDPDDSSHFLAINDLVDFEARPSKGHGGRSSNSILSIRANSRQRSHDSVAKLFSSPFGTPLNEVSQAEGGLSIPTSSESDKSLLEQLIQKERVNQATSLPSIISRVGKRHSSAPHSTALAVTSVSAEKADRAAISKMTSVASLASIASGSSTPRPVISSRNSIVEAESDGLNSDPEPAFSTLGRGSTIIADSLNVLWNLPSSLRLQSPVNQEKLSNHIKFKFRDGETTFRVTSYFAREFENLRAACGLAEDLFISSLSRCQSLSPSGGKSKSVFLETQDSRFILKELVTAWGVSERDAFLSFCPDLLEYLRSPERPSLLAKIYGFYTIKIKNNTTGEVERKLDLVVLENLLHSVDIDRQYDLKGIPTRIQSKPGENTLLDGDWMNSKIDNRVLLYSHSKSLLRQALANDTQFLASHGLIDYSLLVGIDDKKKELVVGLIDTLGVYNLAKLLENKGKTTLAAIGSLNNKTSSSQITVIPPDEYASRFRTAMDRYFHAVPEKFSKPPGVQDDAELRLSSIL